VIHTSHYESVATVYSLSYFVKDLTGVFMKS